jgi:hypothetical protein
MPPDDSGFLRDDALVVIRTAGERTTSWCQQLVGRQITPQHIHTIREVPFSQAVIRTFELGLKFDLTWTIAVDADVLVHSRALHSLVGLAELARPSDFRLDARLFDKLFGGPRCVGMHLYRTAHLQQALKIALVAESVHRPEFHVVQQMRLAGFTDAEVEPVLGLHDYEQFYRDLYRKGYVHAQKHVEFLDPLQGLWQRHSVRDNDFRAVLAGSRQGQETGGIALTDATKFEQNLSALGLGELVEKDATDSTPLDVEKIVSAAETASEFREFLRIQNSLREDTHRLVEAPGLITQLRGRLQLRTRGQKLANWLTRADATDGAEPGGSTGNDLSEQTVRSTDWFEADCLTPEFGIQISQTAPIACRPESSVELHTLVDHQRLWAFVLGVKSLLRFIDDLQVVLHDDGTLTSQDFRDASFHIPGIRIVTRAEADERLAESLCNCPASREFRDNNIVMAQVFDFPILAETRKFIAFDSDILVHSHPAEIGNWISSDRGIVLYEAATAPFCPRIDGVDITRRQDIPFRFAENLCGGFVCGYTEMYEPELTERYCKFVLENCHDRLFRAQTITALSVAHSRFSPAILPDPYQNLHTFSDDPVSRHYYFSGLPPTTYLKDARVIVEELQ